MGGPTGQMAGSAFQQFLQPYDPQQYQELFQKSFIDPAQQALQRQIIPGIKEQFMGLDETGSSALNQALAQSATDLSTQLGSQYMNQFNQRNQNMLQALGLLGGMGSQRTFEPMIQQSQGILGPLIGMLGQLGGAGILGSLTGPPAIQQQQPGRPIIT